MANEIEVVESGVILSVYSSHTSGSIIRERTSLAASFTNFVELVGQHHNHRRFERPYQNLPWKTL